MDALTYLLDGSFGDGLNLGLPWVLISLLLAFILGQALAWVYTFTHHGLSYSKSFVQSLILITVVVSMVMSAIGNSLITAVGLMGALAIIRFRNMVKDTRDIAFIFCALVVGMATGAHRFGIAIAGTLILCLIAVYLCWTDFGSTQPRHGFLRLRLGSSMGKEHPVPGILKAFCSGVTLISAEHEAGDLGVEYAYQVQVRNAARNQHLLSELEEIEDMREVRLTMQEQLLEI